MHFYRHIFIRSDIFPEFIKFKLAKRCRVRVACILMRTCALDQPISETKSLVPG